MEHQVYYFICHFLSCDIKSFFKNSRFSQLLYTKAHSEHTKGQRSHTSTVTAEQSAFKRSGRLNYSEKKALEQFFQWQTRAKDVSCCVGGWLFFHGNKKDGHREKFFNNLVMICLCKAWIRRKSGMVISVSSFSTLKYRLIFTVRL